MKDIVFHYLSGYTVGWHSVGIQKEVKWYESDEWDWNLDKYFNPYAPVVNKDYIPKHFPEYRYSAVELTTHEEVVKYLRMYEKYPQVEHLTKLGLNNYVFSKQILALAGKDKGFRKYLSKNRQELRLTSCFIAAIIDSYKKNISICEANAFHNARNDLLRSKNYGLIKDMFKGEIAKLIDYIAKQKASIPAYQDYLIACRELGLDMTISKNRYPHDFRRWHDIRADEYRTMKAIKDEQQRKEFYAHFKEIATKYLGLEYDKKSVYIAIIAQKPSDLIHEGEILHHCVGRMGYDQKFAREETLIFFIRTKEQPDTPLVTVEYSPTQKKVLQCYGDHDSKPTEEILDFVHKKWLPYANKQIKQIAAA